VKPYWKQDGPYLRFEISFWGWYEKGLNILFSQYVDGSITNLMNVPIEKVSVVFLISSGDRKVTDEISLDLYSIPPGAIERFSQKMIPVTKTFMADDWYLDILKTVIVYKDGINVEVTVSYTLAVTRTNTYATTATITYTMSEPLDFLGSTGGILLFAVAAVAVILAVAAFSIRGKAHAPPVAPSPISPPPETPSVRTKHCPECGLAMPLDAKHCPKCGAKQDYFGED
jgi:hypothetical protein